MCSSCYASDISGDTEVLYHQKTVLWMIEKYTAIFHCHIETSTDLRDQWYPMIFYFCFHWLRKIVNKINEQSLAEQSSWNQNYDLKINGKAD